MESAFRPFICAGALQLKLRLFCRPIEKRILRTTAKRGAPQTPYGSAADRINALQKNAFAAQKLWSCSRIKINRFRFCTSIVLDALRICAARTDAGAEQSGVRSASGGTGDVFRVGGLLYLAVRRRTSRNVCLYLQTAQKRRPPHRQPRTASYLRAPHNVLSAEQKSGCRRMRGGSGIVRFSRSGNADVCGASACAAAFARKQNASALFFARRRKGVSLLRRIWNAAARRRFREAGVRGRSLRLCAGKCGIACRCSTRKSPTAKPKRPSRFRPSPLRVSARRIGNAAAESGEAVFAANKKSVCGAQPQTLIVHPFFFASR